MQTVCLCVIFLFISVFLCACVSVCGSQMEVYVDDTYVIVGVCGCVQDVSCFDLAASLHLERVWVRVYVCVFVGYSMAVTCVSQAMHTCLTLSSECAES